MREDFPGDGLVENAGSIVISDNGSVVSTVPLNNAGTIEMEAGVLGLNLFRYAQRFNYWTNWQHGLSFSNSEGVSAVEHTFQNTSSVTASNMLIDGADLDVSGTFNITSATGTWLSCQGNAELTFQEAATLVALSERLTLAQCHMSLPASLSGFEQPKLRVSNSSQLTNLGNWRVSTEMLWYGGTLDGTGTTTVLTGSNYRMYGVGGLQLKWSDDNQSIHSQMGSQHDHP